MLILKIIYTTCLIAFLSIAATDAKAQKQMDYNEGISQYALLRLSEEEKEILNDNLKDLHAKYDDREHMVTNTLTGWNYHTDAEAGVFHEVRKSFSYAAALLNLEDDQYLKRAFDVIEKTISLQDRDLKSKSFGVWPYYLEEPLASKKSPVDYNWADFNGSTLLDVWMGHQSRIPEYLKPKIKEALIMAAQSIQKRNVSPGYTNIAIKGTYVTYMVSHLFDLNEMKEYARKRLEKFYLYTLSKGGFTEYNSPTYTIEALEDLTRMQMRIVQPLDKKMIDSLYYIGWNMVARHYHQPTAQWAGPHSRSYSTLIMPWFYGILKRGSNGRIHIGKEKYRFDVKVKPEIPEKLMPYFLSPRYPRSEIDSFEREKPSLVGTSYLAKEFAISTVNMSSLWNQRRPLLTYWGNTEIPKYLQVRFLHDGYDFSSATFFSHQRENNVLAAVNFITNGGDKHINIDRLKDGKFKAKDLRLRFEFGNISPSALSVPSSANEPFTIELDNLMFNLQLYYAAFNNLQGFWEKGGDGKVAWIDFIVYKGSEQELDLTSIDRAALGFSFDVQKNLKKHKFSKAVFSEKDGVLNATWNNLKVAVPVKPQLSQNRLL